MHDRNDWQHRTNALSGLRSASVKPALANGAGKSGRIFRAVFWE
jgi:hypothetical protein